MIVHFELAQESRRSLIEAEFGHIGLVINLRNNTQCECSAVADHTELEQSKFIRLSRESLLDLEGPQLKALSDLCLAAHRSEEFFVIQKATDQWLRTVIGHKDFHPRIWTEAEPSSQGIPGIFIHSNVLPYDPYWSKLRAMQTGASMRVHFPSRMLMEALEEGKPLKTKLLEWKGTGNECEIGKHGLTGRYKDHGNCEQPRTSKLFRAIQAADVEFVKELHAHGSDGAIWLITWRGAMFVQKLLKGAPAHFDLELEVVKRFSHPNIIYSFGKLEDGMQSSYFMECMSSNLFSFIIDRMDRVVADNMPPFSPHDTVDILLQVAKAMRHMHQEDVNVVHCDLKSMNILISEITTSDNTSHYLVKVADFGSARLGNSSSGSAGFMPGCGSTNYAAPEVLKKRIPNSTLLINLPHKIDVYSFGVVAYEVLTGKNTVKLCQHSPSKFKKGVIEDNWRPPLRTECEKHKEFIQDKELISLIEICWHADPSQRPSFVKICEELNKVRVRIPEQMLQSDHPPRRVNPIFKCLEGLGVTRKNECKRMKL